jgi:transaldolase
MTVRENPLRALQTFGQSVWLDFLSRGLLRSGQLAELIADDGLRGVTSNPAIFEKAINHSHDYDETIARLASQGKSVEEIYRNMVVEDIQDAADALRPLYDKLHGNDGFVSLEVSPRLARDTQATLAEARELWSLVNRPNAFIKVPGTREGLPAIEQLLAEGVNVNITLLFDLARYRDVVEAYLRALERRAAQGRPLDRIASVASFFISRIDTLVDERLEEATKRDPAKAESAAALCGRVAVASAKVAYEIHEEVIGSQRFGALAAGGARPQRLLWASTGTKNPHYSDVMYVEPLVGPDTVTTLPMETLEAYRDHGKPAARLKDGRQEAHSVLRRLGEVPIDLTAITGQLEEEGIVKFVEPFERLMAALRERRAAAGVH